jgi:tetratricopeptide (TPR) repeat protein
VRRLAALVLAALIVAASSLARADPPPEEAVVADRLFATGKWSEAAVLYHRVARGTGNATITRQVAGYRVAVTLHYLGLHQASLGAFAAIADDPGHPRFGATLVWLSGLSTVLAEPDEVVALLGRYSLADAAPYDNPTQRQVFMRIAALIGRSAYRARRFDDAVRAFAEVRPSSPHYVEAELFTALAHVQRRKAEPALRALTRLREVLEASPPGPERSRLLDLVHLSVARISYSRAVAGLDPSGRGPTIDPEALREALESYARVDRAGPSWQEALFESAWADFMAGDLARALGNLMVLRAPVLRSFVNPEVPILQGEISFALCQLDAAGAFGSQARDRFGPVRREIAALVARLDAAGGVTAWLRLPSDPRGAGLGPDARALVAGALSDRQLRRRLAHARDAEAEVALLGRMPAAFRASALGADTRDALDLARDLAARSAASLVRARLLRALDEIDRHLEEASALLGDVARARAEHAGDRRPAVGEGGSTSTPQRRGRSSLPAFVPVISDRDHEAWPFDGEVWADEIGSYRAEARSRCPPPRARSR